jgi:hypothetical protein
MLIISCVDAKCPFIARTNNINIPIDKTEIVVSKQSQNKLMIKIKELRIYRLCQFGACQTTIKYCDTGMKLHVPRV